MRHVALLLLLASPIAQPLAAAETRGSAAAKFAREFAASDTDRDGVLSKAEVTRRIAGMQVGGRKPDAVHAKRLAGLWFDRADADHDGKVSQPEAQALLTRTFDRYDNNQNGEIGSQEKAAAKKAIVR